MNLSKRQLSYLNVVRGWSESDVVVFLQDNSLEEYIRFSKEKSLDGNRLLSLSEGIIAMWKPKIDHKKIMNAINDLIQNPEKYLNKQKTKDDSDIDNSDVVEKKSNKDTDSLKPLNSIDLTPPKSFLYGDKIKLSNTKCNTYLPMEGNSDFEINVDTQKFKDRGYYEMSNQTKQCSNTNFDHREDNPYEELNFNRHESDKKKTSILKRILRQPTQKKEERKTNNEECNSKKINRIISRKVDKKIISLPIINQNVNKTDIEDDFDHTNKSELKSYKKIDDLTFDDCLTIQTIVNFPEYSEIDDNNDFNSTDFIEADVVESQLIIKTEVHRLSQIGSKLDDEIGVKKIDHNTDNKRFLEEHFYETPEMREDLLERLYLQNETECTPKLPVEEYLEPRQCYPSYGEAIMDSLADEMIKLFDAASLTAKQDIKNNSTEEETTQSTNGELTQSTENMKSVNCSQKEKPPAPKKPPLPICSQPKGKRVEKTHVILPLTEEDDEKPFDTLQKWKDTLKNNVKKNRESTKMNMAERPLPVPVENEFYYMEVSRAEAESLLEGQPDGTFILRPSSQSSHAYTVTLMYQERIYNIGCRRRQDGRLALGFTKATEPNFLTIHELIEYYYNEKLVLLVDGKQVGSTVLKRLHP